MKINPEELKTLADEINGVIDGHREIMDREPAIRKNLVGAKDEALKKFEEVGNFMGRT